MDRSHITQYVLLWDSPRKNFRGLFFYGTSVRE